ncbi:glycerol-3-phosphate 1-O-acyltransferase PlsY [Ancylobacter terrae]|uniref:glycerol-3-phosphate 1-O-acyltransferase PlsY n=1 Tax=Ancylobacter sp. sgz301288 TaxID=3342077 RepID=UPI0038591A14
MSEAVSYLPGILAVVLGYLLGSIPFGLIFTRMAGTQDIRTIGSGNIGATNVLRTGRKGLAAATLLADALKGTAAVLIARHFLGGEPAVYAGLAAFFGHVYPVWLRFKGGKGVATFLGVALGLYWPAAAAFAVVWLVSAKLTKYSSLSALAASVAAAAVTLIFGDITVGALMALLAAMIWITHRENIERLMAGTEGKIGSKA